MSKQQEVENKQVELQRLQKEREAEEEKKVEKSKLLAPARQQVVKEEKRKKQAVADRMDYTKKAHNKVRYKCGKSKW